MSDRNILLMCVGINTFIAALPFIMISCADKMNKIRWLDDDISWGE